MTENCRPILFSGEMVRAILGGRKSQTRRVAKEFWSDAYAMGWCEKVWKDHRLGFCGQWAYRNPTTGANATVTSSRCPYGAPGDYLWVRETFVVDGKTFYRATDDLSSCGMAVPWKPSIFMPRWASRITLEITEVRVQRLQEITEDDAKAEGIQSFENGYPRSTGEPYAGYLTEYGLTNWIPTNEPTAARAFKRLWDSLNAKRGFAWSVNPWVWAITFRRIA